MKPPMKQSVTAYIPIFEKGKPVTNDFGKPKTQRKSSKARVQFKIQLVRDAQGQEHRVNLEIDIPPEFNPDVGVKLDYQMIDGRTASGTIRAKEEVANLTASKVYYRTVFVDG